MSSLIIPFISYLFGKRCPRAPKEYLNKGRQSIKMPTNQEGEFMDFCAVEGIKRELTVPYNPQQNGVAERKNRAIVGVARAMLHDQGLPLFLWAEACYTVVYLQNRSPHKAVGSMTPEEAFSGKKPEVGHFRIFGCITYSYVPSEKRTKLEPMAERGIFVGTVRLQRLSVFTFLP
jgi:hypothetical protein